jgi:uncharacterized protein Yka (UPF0111/DUF47 family)
VIDRLKFLLKGVLAMAKRKPACTVEKTIAGIAQAIHEVREEGESTDRMLSILSRGVEALTARVDNLERESLGQSLKVVELFAAHNRTWLQWFRGE